MAIKSHSLRFPEMSLNALGDASRGEESIPHKTSQTIQEAPDTDGAGGMEVNGMIAQLPLIVLRPFRRCH
jgi:hypothetical protein